MRSNGIKLFRLFGIDVYLHWLWILVAVYEINARAGRYSSPVWNVAEYLSVFAIVLMHEFGHALACKSVGGVANRIMLWPLGGVAFVDPPQRPGAVLWSIAAGPLVNVVLAPFAFGAWALAVKLDAQRDVQHFLFTFLLIDVFLFCFNMLPIYPLDGGQIVRALLWYFIGRAKSLFVASVVGMVGGLAVMAFALSRRDTWLIVLAAFGMMVSFRGFKNAQTLAKMMKLPRHRGFACPSCNEPPPSGGVWSCPCGMYFDTFETGAKCPQCGRGFETTQCLFCGSRAPFAEWVTGDAETGSPEVTRAEV